METFIREYNNRLTREECNQIIKFHKDSPDQHPGITLSGIIPDKTSMDVDIIVKRGGEEIDKIIYDELKIVFQEYLKEFENTGLINCYANLNIFDSSYIIQKYNKNEGKYDWHGDAGFGSGSTPRHFSVILYLNDVEEGGETEYKYQNVSVKPEAGKFIIAPSYPQWEHRGAMPTSDDKYIVTTFMCG